MKLATTTADFGAYHLTQQETVGHICQAGFRYIDYNFGLDYNRRNGAYSDSWKEHLADVRAHAERLGASFVQAHSPMGKPILRGDYHTDFVNDTIRAIEGCAILGIPNIVVHSGYEQDISKEECFERNRDFFMELMPAAEQAGVNILVENFNKMCIDGMYWVDNAPDLRAMIDYVDHPLFHACWDTGHGNMQELPQDEALRILGHHVYALHVQDNLGDNDTHLAPYCGTLSMDSLMNGLKDIGYKGAFTFEACNFFLPAGKRRPFEKDERLLLPPLNLKLMAESMLLEIGKTALTAYGFDIE